MIKPRIIRYQSVPSDILFYMGSENHQLSGVMSISEEHYRETVKYQYVYNVHVYTCAYKAVCIGGSITASCTVRMATLAHTIRILITPTRTTNTVPLSHYGNKHNNVFLLGYYIYKQVVIIIYTCSLVAIQCICTCIYI